MADEIDVSANEIAATDDDVPTEAITLNYEDGTSEECDVIGVFEHEGALYIALAPLDSDELVYFFSYTEYDDGTFDVEEIESDELFEAVGQTFGALIDAEDEE